MSCFLLNTVILLEFRDNGNDFTSIITFCMSKNSNQQRCCPAMWTNLSFLSSILQPLRRMYEFSACASTCSDFLFKGNPSSHFYPHLHAVSVFFRLLPVTFKSSGLTEAISTLVTTALSVFSTSLLTKSTESLHLVSPESLDPEPFPHRGTSQSTSLHFYPVHYGWKHNRPE